MSHADATTTQAALEASGMAVTRIFDGRHKYSLLVRDASGRVNEIREPLRLTTKGAAGKLGRRGKA